MGLISKIKIDMVQKGSVPVVYAVQGEGNTRTVNAILYKNGEPFLADGYSVSLAFKKPDGTSGWYDTLENGDGATDIDGNQVTVTIAEEVLTVAGEVVAAIRLDNPDGPGRSTAFPFLISVSPDPAIDSPKSENYYSVQTWDDVNAAIAELYALVGGGGGGGGGSVEGAVLYTEQTLTEEQKAQARENIGASDDADIDYLPSKNLFNISTVVYGSWANYSSGKIENYPANQYIANYRRSDYIPVSGGKKYAYSGGHTHHDIGQTALTSYAYYDSAKNFISGATPNKTVMGAIVLTAPDNAAYIIINFTGDNVTYNVQLEEGTIATEYEPYAAKEKYYKNNLVIKKEQVEEMNVELFHLPQKYNLVVGDTFELFYKGIMLCKDPYRYNIIITCDIGNAFSRKFVVTPTETGTHTLTVQAMDDFGIVIDEASTELVVSSKMASPAEQVNVLCVGDSLTAGGQWVDEVYRRLTKTTDVTQHNADAPTGDGLSNIAFVGKKITANRAGYEGTGGWTYNSYLDTSNADNPFLYNGSVDFSAYCAELGIDVIDRCYILLGWNMATNTEAVFKEKAKAFINLLIAHNPAVKITLVGVEIPALDGLGENYNVTNGYSKYRALQEFVFNLDKWNVDIASDYPGNVSALSIAGQFDTENNMPTTTKTVNARSAKTFTMQNNGIHPANEGYYQIADAVYRKFTADNN